MDVLWLTPYPVSNLIQGVKKGHAASWIINLSKELINQGVKLTILTHSSVINENIKVKRNNIHFIVLKHSIPFMHKGFPWFFPYDKITNYRGLIKKYKEIINKLEPDIIHAHGTENVFALAASETKYPTIISIQGIMAEIFKYEKTIPNLLQIYLEKKAILNNVNFGCRTKFDSDFVKKYNPKANIFFLPEAINNIFFEANWKVIDNPTIIYVGNIIYRKGIETLLEAVSILKKRNKDIKLVLIGSGKKQYLKHITKILVKNNIQNNVNFLGTQSPETIVKEFLNAKIFVLPSFVDNSPNSLAEAMAIGLPTIASNIGGIPSMIKDGYDGFLFKVGDPIQLSQRIQFLFDNTGLLKNISHNAKETAMKRNFPVKVAQNTIDVYKKICSKK